MSLRSERVTQLGSVPRFRLGPLLVEPERLTLIDDGRTITLEPRMMEVLIALAERAGEVISAEQLLIEVWHGSFYGDNPVHKTIAQLRRKLGDDSRQPRFIETIRKRGYRLLPKVVFPDDYRGAVIGTPAWGMATRTWGCRHSTRHMQTCSSAAAMPLRRCWARCARNCTAGAGWCW